MMKHEFEELANMTVDEKTYEAIETVYMYYPNMEVKEQIVGLFKTYGMVLISDMLPRATKIKELETQKLEIACKIRDLTYLTEKTLELKEKVGA